MNWKIFLLIVLSLSMTIGYPYSIIIHQNLFFGLLILIYCIVQILFAIKNLYAMRSIDIGDASPSVCILVIGYRENPSYWVQCLRSIIGSRYENITALHAFIDGDQPEDQYMRTLFEDTILEHASVSYPTRIHMRAHAGKRHAMEAGFRHVLENYPENEYIIIMDSDTVVRPDAVQKLIECMHADPRNGCATGNLRIFNKTTWLARIIDARYSYAFMIERGAMSAMGVMNCCSGPFSIYRQAVLDQKLLDEFVNQNYCGRAVGPGDDRHLTLLVLGRGHFSRQTPLAIIETETPDTMHRYFQQQLRWMRSFYREQIWQIRAIPHQSVYLMIITLYELFFPIFIIMSLFPIFQIRDRTLFFMRLLIAIGILLVRTLILLCFTRFRPESLWNLFVFPMYFIYLLPLKLYAMLSVGAQGWITSARNQYPRSIMDLFRSDIFFIYASIFLWNGMLAYLLFLMFHDTAIKT